MNYLLWTDDENPLAISCGLDCCADEACYEIITLSDEEYALYLVQKLHGELTRDQHIGDYYSLNDAKGAAYRHERCLMSESVDLAVALS